MESPSDLAEWAEEMLSEFSSCAITPLFKKLLENHIKL